MRKSAFTIIELILTITILAILAGPVVVTVYNHANVASEGAVRENINIMISKARLLSCSYCMPASIIFDKHSQTVRLMWRSATASGNAAANAGNKNVIASYNMPKAVKIGNVIDKVNFSTGNMITFYPNGMSDNVNLEIIIDNKVVLYDICPYSGVFTNQEVAQERVIDLDNSDVSLNDVFR